MTSTASAMEFAAALSTDADTTAAIREVCRSAAASFAGPADLALLFASPHHVATLAVGAAEIATHLEVRTLLGCTGESIVGPGREIEHEPALVLWLARLPGVSLRPVRLEFVQTPEGGSFVGWPDDLPASWPRGATLLALADPFSFPADVLMERLASTQPGVPVLGGNASAAHAPGGNRLLLGREAFRSGAVAVLIDGPVAVRTVVSQGCRPIGKPFVVTKAEGQLVYQLSGKPALEQLQTVVAALTPDEQQQVRSGLHLGRVTNEYQESFTRGDFLIRNVIGADGDTQAIAVGDFVRVGCTVQFHIRDAASADEDLRELLLGRANEIGAAPAGGLLFTCNGRGSRLFDEPDHDAAAVAAALGPIPVAGFFAMGEFGPVGGKNFVHGFTASLAVFSPP